MNHEAEVLRWLQGVPRGLTRTELSYRLGQHDRTVRQAIEDLVSSGRAPIIADRSSGGEARYRIAGRDEHEAVREAHAELVSRAISLNTRARGLTIAFQAYHGAGSLFMPVTLALEAAS